MARGSKFTSLRPMYMYIKWSNTRGWKDEKMFAFNDHFTFHITESLNIFPPLALAVCIWVYMALYFFRWQSSPKCPSQSTLSVLILLSNLCLLPSEKNSVLTFSGKQNLQRFKFGTIFKATAASFKQFERTNQNKSPPQNESLNSSWSI